MQVQEFAGHIIAERGVRHGHVVYLPAGHAHSHGRGETHHHGYRHSPRRRAAWRPKRTPSQIP